MTVVVFQIQMTLDEEKDAEGRLMVIANDNINIVGCLVEVDLVDAGVKSIC